MVDVSGTCGRSFSVVRNEMRNFQVAHLSDTEMAGLNPSVRNAIATPLHRRTGLLSIQLTALPVAGVNQTEGCHYLALAS